MDVFVEATHPSAADVEGCAAVHLSETARVSVQLCVANLLSHLGASLSAYYIRARSNPCLFICRVSDAFPVLLYLMFPELGAHIVSAAVIGAEGQG